MHAHVRYTRHMYQHMRIQHIYTYTYTKTYTYAYTYTYTSSRLPTDLDISHVCVGATDAQPRLTRFPART